MSKSLPSALKAMPPTTHFDIECYYCHSSIVFTCYRHYEDVLKLLKWPFSSGVEHSPPPKEVLVKFNNLTRYLFLIQEPEDITRTATSDEFVNGKSL